MPPSKVADIDLSNGETTDNPYLSVIFKRHRFLKKKLEKILKVEVQQTSGKALDEGQMVLLASKLGLERSMADIEAIKSQLEEVAKTIAAQAQTVLANPPKFESAPSAVSPKAAVGATLTPVEEATVPNEDTTAKASTSSAVSLPSPDVVTEGKAASTPAPPATLPAKDLLVLSKTSEQKAVPLQFGSVPASIPLLFPIPVEAATPPTSSSAAVAVTATMSSDKPLFKQKRIAVSNLTGAATASTQGDVAVVGSSWLGNQTGPEPATLSASIVLEQSERLLKKLLKVLHVCARYQTCTGKPLPPTIDYFGQTLLGMTSISNFPQRLDGSLRSAGLYLNDDLSSTQEVRGLTYQVMSAVIDGLAVEMETSPSLGVSASISAAGTCSKTLPVPMLASSAADHPAPATVASPVTPTASSDGYRGSSSSSSALFKGGDNVTSSAAAKTPAHSVAGKAVAGIVVESGASLVPATGSAKGVPTTASVPSKSSIGTPTRPSGGFQSPPGPSVAVVAAVAVEVSGSASVTAGAAHTAVVAPLGTSTAITSRTVPQETESASVLGEQKHLVHGEVISGRGDGRPSGRGDGRGYQGRGLGRGDGRGDGRGEGRGDGRGYQGRGLGRGDGRGDGRGEGRGDGRGYQGRGYGRGEGRGEGRGYIAGRGDSTSSTAIPHAAAAGTSHAPPSAVASHAVPTPSDHGGRGDGPPQYGGRDGGRGGRGRDNGRGRGSNMQMTAVPAAVSVPGGALSVSPAPVDSAMRRIEFQINSSGNSAPPSNPRPPTATSTAPAPARAAGPPGSNSNNNSSGTTGPPSGASKPPNAPKAASTAPNGVQANHSPQPPRADQGPSPSLNKSTPPSVSVPGRGGGSNSNSNGGRGPNGFSGSSSGNNGRGRGPSNGNSNNYNSGRGPPVSTSAGGRLGGQGANQSLRRAPGDPMPPYQGTPAPSAGFHLMSAQSGPTSNSSGTS